MLSLVKTKHVFEQPSSPGFHFIHVRILCLQFVLYRTIKCTACVCCIIRGQVQVLLLLQYCLVVLIQYKLLKPSWDKSHWNMPYEADAFELSCLCTRDNHIWLTSGTAKTIGFVNSQRRWDVFCRFEQSV